MKLDSAAKGFSMATAALFIAGLLLLETGCSTEPVKDTSFIPKPDMMKKYDLVPVQRLWKNPKITAANYDKVIVLPVYTKDLQKGSGMETANIRTWLGNENSDTADFANYMAKAFREAVSKSKSLKLAEQPGAKTLALELNLVKIVPGKPVLGAIKNLSNLTPIGFIISPIKMGVGATTDSPMQASVAIEGKIYDSQTKEMLFMFADREKQSTAFFNLNDFTAYGNLHQIADEWAAQFVNCLEKHPFVTGEKIDKPLNFEFINY